ncbi:MAG: hypothetical protein WAU54_16495 [Chania sp.]
MANNTVIIDNKSIDKSTQSIKEYCKNIKNAASGTASLAQATDKLNAIAVDCSDALNNLKGNGGKSGGTVINISLSGAASSENNNQSAIKKLLSDKISGDAYSVSKKNNDSYNRFADEVSSLAPSFGPYGVATAVGTRITIGVINSIDKKISEMERDAISVLEYYDKKPLTTKADEDRYNLALNQLITAMEREKLLKEEGIKEKESEYKRASEPMSLEDPDNPQYDNIKVTPPEFYSNPAKLAIEAARLQLENHNEILDRLKGVKESVSKSLNNPLESSNHLNKLPDPQSEDSQNRLTATITLQKESVNFAEQHLAIRRLEREEEQKLQELAAAKAKEDERKQQIAAGQQYAKDLITKANPPSALDQINNNEQDQLATVGQSQMVDLANYQLYEDAKTAIATTASQQRIELHRQEGLTQVTSLQNGMSSMSGAVGSLMNVAELTGGKDSAAYQQMFALSKGFAVSQAMVSLQLAIMQAMSDSTSTNPMQKFANMAAVAAAGAGVLSTLASVTLSGQAHSGIDYIPREGTWLLDRGERVVDSRTNADLKQFLNGAPSSGGGSSLSINVPVTVQNDGGGSSMSAEGLSQLAGMIKSKVYEVVSNEQRPGGLLNRGAYA